MLKDINPFPFWVDYYENLNVYKNGKLINVEDVLTEILDAPEQFTHELKSDTPKEIIQEYFRAFANIAVDEQVLSDAKKLSIFMIEEFKNTNCYLAKTEEEREEIITYLKENPDAIDNSGINAIIL